MSTNSRLKSWEVGVEDLKLGFPDFASAKRIFGNDISRVYCTLVLILSDVGDMELVSKVSIIKCYQIVNLIVRYRDKLIK